MNETIEKFGYPQTRVAEYGHWVVLLRPQQVTLGALVLACKEASTAFSKISPAAFAELGRATADIESTLAEVFDYRKINYLMLMMVDPHVHFHVLPRYDEDKAFAGAAFRDAGWPAAPDLGAVNDLDDAGRGELVAFLRDRWPTAD